MSPEGDIIKEFQHSKKSMAAIGFPRCRFGFQEPGNSSGQDYISQSRAVDPGRKDHHLRVKAQ